MQKACAKRKVFNNYHSALQTADDDLVGRLWNTIFGLSSKPGTYARPVAKRDVDIQWKERVPCSRFGHIGYRETNNCPFCETPQDILHIFVKCSRLRELSLYLMSLLKCFNASLLLTPQLWLYGCQ